MAQNTADPINEIENLKKFPPFESFLQQFNDLIEFSDEENEWCYHSENLTPERVSSLLAWINELISHCITFLTDTEDLSVIDKELLSKEMEKVFAHAKDSKLNIFFSLFRTIDLFQIYYPIFHYYVLCYYLLKNKYDELLIYEYNKSLHELATINHLVTIDRVKYFNYFLFFRRKFLISSLMEYCDSPSNYDGLSKISINLKLHDSDIDFGVLNTYSGVKFGYVDISGEDDRSPDKKFGTAKNVNIYNDDYYLWNIFYDKDKPDTLLGNRTLWEIYKKEKAFKSYQGFTLFDKSNKPLSQEQLLKQLFNMAKRLSFLCSMIMDMWDSIIKTPHLHQSNMEKVEDLLKNIISHDSIDFPISHEFLNILISDDIFNNLESHNRLKVLITRDIFRDLVSSDLFNVATRDLIKDQSPYDVLKSLTSYYFFKELTPHKLPQNLISNDPYKYILYNSNEFYELLGKVGIDHLDIMKEIQKDRNRTFIPPDKLMILLNANMELEILFDLVRRKCSGSYIKRDNFSVNLWKDAEKYYEVSREKFKVLTPKDVKGERKFFSEANFYRDVRRNILYSVATRIGLNIGKTNLTKILGLE